MLHDRFSVVIEKLALHIVTASIHRSYPSLETCLSGWGGQGAACHVIAVWTLWKIRGETQPQKQILGILSLVEAGNVMQHGHAVSVG